MAAFKGFLKRNSFIVDRLVSSLQSRILAVSHACPANDLIAIKKIPAGRITVVQNGEDFAEFFTLLLKGGVSFEGVGVE